MYTDKVKKFRGNNIFDNRNISGYNFGSEEESICVNVKIKKNSAAVMWDCVYVQKNYLKP